MSTQDVVQSGPPPHPGASARATPTGSSAAPVGVPPSDVESFCALADALPQLVWITDADGRSEYHNRRWLDYTGASAGETYTHGWHAAICPNDRERAIACWESSVRTGEQYQTEYRLRRGIDGEYRWFLARGEPFRDAEGRVTRWFGTCTDIHDQKTAELALRREKETSEQNGRAKDEFLSIVSHELRTPLSAILGWTQLLEMDALDDAERREAVQIIKQQAKVQSQLIEDLLEVSRILNGKFHMREQLTELWRVLHAAVESVRPLAASSGITLTHAPWDRTLLVRGDPQRLQQVIWNLLVNAIKFTPQGGSIDLELGRESGLASVTVRDSGRGIPVDQIDAIFDRFTQVEPMPRRAKGGSGGLGLGLSIAKHIVQLHGGTITARSAGVGLGSVFCVSLPVETVPAAGEDSMPSNDIVPDGETLFGLTLLLVDDEESARAVAATALRKFGAQVSAVPNAAAAWEALQKSSFDVVISDMAMPGDGGIDFIQRVRGSTLPFKNIPAIALTAFASVDDQTRALAAGFQLHVAKPIEPVELARRVLSVTWIARQPTGSA